MCAPAGDATGGIGTQLVYAGAELEPAWGPRPGVEFSGEEKGTSRGPRASLSPEFPRCFGLFILRRDVHVSPDHMVVKHSGGPRGDWSLEKLGIDSITHDSAIRWSTVYNTQSTVQIYPELSRFLTTTRYSVYPTSPWHTLVYII